MHLKASAVHSAGAASPAAGGGARRRATRAAVAAAWGASQIPLLSIRLIPIYTRLFAPEGCGAPTLVNATLAPHAGAVEREHDRAAHRGAAYRR